MQCGFSLYLHICFQWLPKARASELSFEVMMRFQASRWGWGSLRVTADLQTEEIHFPGQNNSFGRWTLWHHIPAEVLPSPYPSAQPKPPRISQDGAGNPLSWHLGKQVIWEKCHINTQKRMVPSPGGTWISPAITIDFQMTKIFLGENGCFGR